MNDRRWTTAILLAVLLAGTAQAQEHDGRTAAAELALSRPSGPAGMQPAEEVPAELHTFIAAVFLDAEQAVFRRIQEAEIHGERDWQDQEVLALLDQDRAALPIALESIFRSARTTAEGRYYRFTAYKDYPHPEGPSFCGLRSYLSGWVAEETGGLRLLGHPHPTWRDSCVAHALFELPESAAAEARDH